MAQWVKNPPANAGDAREVSSIPGSERFPEGGGHGNPLQYSCLENPMDGKAWRATVHRVTKSDIAKATEHACSPINGINDCIIRERSYYVLFLLTFEQFVDNSIWVITSIVLINESKRRLFLLNHFATVLDKNQYFF